MHQVTIQNGEEIIYQQKFAELEVEELITFINRRPTSEPRPRKTRSDKGKPRQPEMEASTE